MNYNNDTFVSRLQEKATCNTDKAKYRLLQNIADNMQELNESILDYAPYIHESLYHILRNLSVTLEDNLPLIESIKETYNK